MKRGRFPHREHGEICAGLQKTHLYLILNFSSVCPEPVLANPSFRNKNGSKKAHAPHRRRRVVHPEELIPELRENGTFLSFFC
jgi:hypothetical protein